MLLAFVVLYFAKAFIGWDHGSLGMGWPVLSQVLGAPLVLIGALNLLKAGLNSTGFEQGPVVIHIAIILVGCVFLPGGWASMLGLAVLGSVALVVQHLSRSSHVESHD